HPSSRLFPYTTLFRSYEIAEDGIEAEPAHQWNDNARSAEQDEGIAVDGNVDRRGHLSAFVSLHRARHILNGAISWSGIHRYPCRDRKSTRLNYSHQII